MDRRAFLKTAGALLGLGLTVPARAFCDEYGSLVQFSPSLAEEYALAFASSFAPDKSLETEQPIPMYDASGNMIGYEVDFTSGSVPSGYVVFDVTCSGLVSRFCVDDNCPGLYSQSVQANSMSRSFSLSSDPVLVKLNPIEYAATQYGDDLLYVNSNSLLQKGEQLSRARPSTEWEDLMVENIYSGFDITETAYGAPVANLTKNTVERRLKRYACGVTALYCIACAVPYPSPSNWQRWLIDFDDINQYTTIWNDTNSYTDHITDGVTYGETDNSDIGPGFAKFCARQGRDIEYTQSANPTYEAFRNQAMLGCHSVFAAGIIKSSTGERSGHAMAVQGVATLGPSGTGVKDRYIYVYDGWSANAFIKLYDDAFTDRWATYFTQ